MSRRIGIVTDSTAYLPPSVVAARGVAVVPLQVVIGATAFTEGSPGTSESVAAAFRSRTPMSTSRPAPAAFLDAYERSARSGYEGVVSVHLSAEMSGTFDSAVLAGREAPLPVQVLDSRCLGMGLGYAVLAAADTADAGASLDEVAAAASRRAASTDVIFYVDTLEYLRRGGRIGAGAAWLGSALGMKPLLHLADGSVAPLEKVRTSARAIFRLEELAAERAGERPVDVAVHHLGNGQRAQALADRLRFRLPYLHDLHLSEIGAVVGAHVGPGMLAVVVAPR